MEWIKRHGYSLALFCVIVLVMLYGFQNAAESSAVENLRMTEDSLRRAVVSCYALEGQYPPDIAYLQNLVQKSSILSTTLMELTRLQLPHTVITI